MLDTIRQYLGGFGTAQRTTANLPDERVAVAAVLLEVAEADRELAPVEYHEIVNLLRAHFGLTQEQVDALLETTRREREQSTDLFPFTHAIARQYTPERKQAVLTMVWRVILADEVLDPYEDQLARRLQSMLSVNHSVLMAAKAAARQAQKARAQGDA
jgi:uncharacterized tellurite resistance protein B-like protein